MNTFVRVMIAVPIAALFNLTISAEPAMAGDAEITLKGRLKQCEPSKSSNTLTPKCLEAILDDRELSAMLDEIPAIRLGVISRESLMLQAERAQWGELVPPARDTDPNEEDYTVHLNPRGGTIFLSEQEIGELEAGRGFDVIGIDIDRDFGPSEISNYPTFPPPGGFPPPKPGFTPPPPNPYELDTVEFLDDIHNALSPNVNGYALKLRHDGQTIGIRQWNWARNPNNGDVPGLGWNTDRRMHIASISKFMTAIGLVHLLESRPGINPDDNIIDWLPDYWQPEAASNIDLITFEDLMDHVSGFGTGGSSTDWPTMKSNVQAGVPALEVGNLVTADYENMNFGLIRILIATIGGYVNPAMSFGPPALNDLMWDTMTWSAYNHYMQTYVFNPVGAFPTIDSNTESVLAYRFDGTQAGWDSGNFSGRAGGAGWHMTIGEILDVARAFRQGNIVTPGGRTDILFGSWGLNSPRLGESTLAGNIYYKAGRWTDNSNAAISRTEQCFILLMPKDMELVVFVNSAVTSAGSSLTNIVRTAYTNNIVLP